MKRPADVNWASEDVGTDVEELVAVAQRVKRKVVREQCELDDLKAKLEQEYKDKETSLLKKQAETIAALAVERAEFEAERTRVSKESVAPSDIITISMGGE